jgi:exodeoxyribonuclease V alpha subunit
MSEQNKPMALNLEGMEETEDSLSGTIARIVHHNEADGWTVARFEAQGYKRPVTIVGHLMEPNADQALLLFGKWAHHPQYGDQFRFERYQLNLPRTKEGLERYLGSGVLKGVGPVTAKRMVAAFGTDVIRILDEEPQRLEEVQGISPAKVEKIKDGWAEQKGVQEVMIFLQGHGISAAYAHRIYKHYGDDAIMLVKENPYRLASEVSGIGFRTADAIAQKLGFSRRSKFRIEAGLAFALEEAAGSAGHVFLPREQLMSAARAALETREELAGDEETGVREITLEEDLVEALDRMLEEGRLVGEVFGDNPEPAIYLPQMYGAERGVAMHLLRLMESPATTQVAKATLDEWYKSSRQVRGITLSQEQADAVKAALSSKVLVITGGPGVGKTTTTKAVVDLFIEAGCKVELACPTGRAAKRLSELTGQQARTIHRLLEMDASNWQFRRNRQNPVDADVVVVDEASMLDLALTRSLLDAIPNGARLILVGDADQLPSVGAGMVLRDLLASAPIGRVELREIFRQQKESLIVTNAHRVNKGLMPRMVNPGAEDVNCLFAKLNDPAAICQRVIELVNVDLAAQGIEPWDVQIITPMHKGELGTIKFNKLLQATLNPAGPKKHEIRRGEKLIREGDRVMQVQNNYSKQVFNGDVGTVMSVQTGEQRVVVQFVDQAADYEAEEMDELELAYGMTVHKSQGSEYPAVIIVLHPSHYVMLQRNLLYTALTRAQKMAVIIGSPQAVWRAVNNNRPVQRFSHLKDRIEGTRGDF